jgi:hypothetical protein
MPAKAGIHLQPNGTATGEKMDAGLRRHDGARAAGELQVILA